MPATRHIDLSHTIEHGMVTYKGLPAPQICDFWSREESRSFYEEGTSFQIGKIEMVANTGTYIDCPFHRFAEGDDLAALDLAALADLPGICVRAPFEKGLEIGPEVFGGLDFRGKAVLVHTGWDRHWRTEAYFSGHPFLTAAAAELLRDGGAKLVGIDAYNIDNSAGRTRPVHTVLLGANILIAEHLANLQSLPDSGFHFTAVPPKIKGMGSFPVRAFARVKG